MPIDVQCPKCGKRLRAPDAHLGKQAKCPQCQAVIVIQPAASLSGAGKAAAAAPSSSEPALWHMLTGENEEYGPITKSELDTWAAEGRLDSTCQVFQDGWEEWKWAEKVYPELAQDEEAASETEPEPATADVAVDGLPSVEAPELKVDATPSPVPQVAPSAPQPTATKAAATKTAATADPKAALQQIQFWSSLVAMLGFVLGAVAIVAGGWYLAANSSAGVLFILVGIFYLLLGGAIAGTAFLLLKFSGQLKARLRSTEPLGQTAELLEPQATFWKIAGIAGGALLAMYLILLIVGITMGGVALEHRPTF